MKDRPGRVRATVNFGGTRAGRVELVNLNDPEVQSKIARGWFVLDEPESAPKSAVKRKRGAK